MPQLDFAIIFTQIFWLFFIFIFCYSALTHFFLPKFLKALKSRNSIVILNKSESIDLQNTFLSNQSKLLKILIDSLIKIRFFHSINFLSNFKEVNSTQNLKNLDFKLVHVVLNLMLYCDEKVLNCIPFYSKAYSTFRRS